jgi:F-type H+-transporting ATPase subunit epsilon
MTKSKIKFKIVTMERVTYEDEIDQLTVPTEAGEITVLARHTPLVSILKPGELKIEKEGYKIFLSVSTGFLQIRKNSEVYVLADTAERVEEIDEEASREARKRAEEMIKQKQYRTDVDFAKLQAIINREVSRLKISEKYRRLKK